MLDVYVSHRVIVEANNGKIFYGMVIDCCSPDENEIQQESIILRDEYSGMLIELYAYDLARIARVNYKIKVKYMKLVFSQKDGSVSSMKQTRNMPIPQNYLR